MKKIYKLIFGLFIVSNSLLNAQVKIADTGDTTINVNSILELESTNKGFLPSRVPIDSLNGVSPLTGTVPAGMLVYSSGGSVNDGYYLWDGTKWKPFTTGVGGINVVTKTTDATLTKDETFVVASGDINITLPEVTVVDNGLSITVKNTGSYIDQVNVAGYNGALIDNNDTVRLYRWKARTFVAYEGKWLRKEKDLSTESVYDVGPISSWTTIPEILAFLAIHMTAPSTVRLDGGTYEIAETQVVDLPFPVTIQGPSYGQAYIIPVTGVEGTPLFSCVSEVSFKMIAFDASALTDYGTLDGENALNLVTSEQYHEIKDCTFDYFNKAIYITNNVDVWLFETDISYSVVAGVEINAGTAKYVSFYTSESSFFECDKGINLVSGDSSTVSVQNCTFDCAAGQIGLDYVSATFLHTISMFFTNNTWNNVGTFVNTSPTGIDYTRSDGRDANMDIENNAGIENKNPKCKINVVNNTTTTTITSNGSWYKVNWGATGSVTYYTINWAVSNNNLKFLPRNTRDVFIILAGNVSVGSNNRTINVAIVKNPSGTSGTAASVTRYGETTLRTTTANQAYQYSTTIYLQNVAKNDIFEVWVNSNNSGDVVIFQDVNIFVNAQ